MSSGVMSSSANEEMMSSLMSFSSCCMGSLCAEEARQFVVEVTCSQRLRAGLGQMGIDRNVVADIDHEVSCAARHAPPLVALAQHLLGATDAHGRDRQFAA